MAELRYVDWDGLVYYDGKIKDFIQANAENYLKMGGILPIRDLPDPSRQNLNYIYKITDSFTSDNHFDKPGYVYPAGTWVQCVNHEEDELWLYTIFNEETIGGTADLSNYYTKSEVDALIPDDFATESDIAVLNEAVAGNQESIEELQTSIDSVEAKVDNIVIPEIPKKLSELENDSGYITEADIPKPELFVVDYNAPDFTVALEAYNSGKLLLLTNAAPDTSSYAVMNYVRDDMITFTKFLMSRSETYGAFNTYYLHNDNSWEVAKEIKLNKVDAIVDDNNDITGLTIGKNTYEFDNFATNETVNQITENIENTYVTNTALEQTKQEIADTYVTEQYVINNYITQADANETFVTNEEVTNVVETQINEVVTNEIETRVETVIQEKVDAGEISVNADAINYDTWD